MEPTLINIADQIIIWFAVTILEMMFVVCAAQMKKHFPVRLLLGNLVGICFVMTYFPFYKFARSFSTDLIETVLIYFWWGIFYFLTIGIVFWWFDLSKGQMLLRGIMGICVQASGNTLIHNFVFGLWLPEQYRENVILFVAASVVCYTILGLAAYFLLAKKMGIMQELYGMDTPLVYGFLVILLIFANVVWDISNGIFKHALQPLTDLNIYSYIVGSVQYFCAVTSLVFSVFVLFILFLFYRISYIRQEEHMLKYLHSEKEKQYVQSKQTIDIIHQKCHDLKRQIQALRFSEDSEREKLYQETQNTADFFNYVVKTDNEMLNTILTEKGLLCHSKNIRLTCTVSGGCFNKISVVDLYTIFSNALDNAIECVENYAEEEKRIITVHISQIGAMNNIMIDNYFEGELHYMNGQIMTSKSDKAYHGFGLKSIRSLVKKYCGETRISCNNHTFSLQIMLPA